MLVATISKKYFNASTIGICYTLGNFARTVLNEAKYLDFYIWHEYEVVAPELIDQLSTGGDLSMWRELHITAMVKYKSTKMLSL